MNIRQFRYAADNFSYVIHTDKAAIAVDAGAVEKILSYIEDNTLELKYVTNTHMHPDHTPGNREILKRSGAVYIDNKTLLETAVIELDGAPIEVLHTPGHTRDSVCFHADTFLVTGDTVFNGTVGNCFSGDLDAFYESIEKIMEYPDNTVIYAGHDYIRESMAFAKYLEPDNVDIERFLSKYDPTFVSSTLADEYKVNPYLRFNEASLVELMKKNGYPVETERQRWKAIMSIE